MSLWARIRLAVSGALSAIARVIEAPIDAVLRPFEAANRNRYLVAERISQLNLRLAAQSAERAAVRRPAGNASPVRAQPQTKPDVSGALDGREPPDGLNPGPFERALRDIQAELQALVHDVWTRRFERAGGRRHPYLDHRRLMDDVGLAQAVEISGLLTHLGEVRRWDFVTRRGEASARAELLEHVEAQGWWDRGRSQPNAFRT